MTNDEAKALYEDAKAQIHRRDFTEALALLEQIETERPNSRRVMQKRVLCLIRLGDLSAAEALLEKLEGRIAEDQFADLKAKLNEASLESIEFEEDKEAPKAQPGVFMVESVYQISLSEATVMGFMESGEVHHSDKLYVRGKEVRILRLGPEDKPIHRLHQGQHGVILLNCDPSLITAGAALRIIPGSRHDEAEPEAMDDSLVLRQTGLKPEISGGDQATQTTVFFTEGSKLVLLLILILILIIVIGLWDIWSWNQ